MEEDTESEGKSSPDEDIEDEVQGASAAGSTNTDAQDSTAAASYGNIGLCSTGPVSTSGNQQPPSQSQAAILDGQDTLAVNFGGLDGPSEGSEEPILRRQMQFRCET